MAVTITTLRKWDTSGTASDGVWLKINLPPHTCSVMVEVSGAAYVDGPGASYTDGGARSSGGRATTSGETVELPIPSSSDSLPIYVAGNGGSRSVSVYPAGQEAR